jgi:hypothetical protein
LSLYEYVNSVVVTAAAAAAAAAAAHVVIVIVIVIVISNLSFIQNGFLICDSKYARTLQ